MKQSHLLGWSIVLVPFVIILFTLPYIVAEAYLAGCSFTLYALLIGRARV